MISLADTKVLMREEMDSWKTINPTKRPDIGDYNRQRELFKQFLEEGDYESARKLVDRFGWPDTAVRYHTSIHLDILVRSGKLDSAWQLADTLGKGVDRYLICELDLTRPQP
jgi:hypothetical protein